MVPFLLVWNRALDYGRVVTCGCPGTRSRGSRGRRPVCRRPPHPARKEDPCRSPTSCSATTPSSPAPSSRATCPCPGKGLAVVACMDARLNVYALLGLEEGQAHVIRNAGGVVTEDVIRSLAISQWLLGTSEIILVHHTDCGMLTFTDDQVKADIEADRSAAPLRPGGLLRPGERHPPVDRPHQGQSLRLQQGLDPRLHLRRAHRPAPGGHLSTPSRLRRHGGPSRQAASASTTPA